MEAEGFIVAPSQKTVDSVFNSCIRMREEHNIQAGSSIQNQLRFADFVRLFLTIKAVSGSTLSKQIRVGIKWHTVKTSQKKCKNILK